MNNLEHYTKENKNKENPSVTFEPIHFRCPDCSKLFSADPLKIFVEEPEFTCTSCSTEFSISLFHALAQDSVVGKKIEREKVFKSEPDVQKKESDFGQVLDQLKQEHKQEYKNYDFEPYKENLIKREWQKVLSDYENRRQHKKFIKACRKYNCLGFAEQRYTQILKNDPCDKVAYIESRQVRLIQEDLEEKAREKNKAYKALMVTALFIVLGCVIVAIGYFLAQDKNVVGLGMGVLFFTFAIQALFQPNTNLRK